MKKIKNHSKIGTFLRITIQNRFWDRSDSNLYLGHLTNTNATCANLNFKFDGYITFKFFSTNQYIYLLRLYFLNMIEPIGYKFHLPLNTNKAFNLLYFFGCLKNISFTSLDSFDMENIFLCMYLLVMNLW